MCRNEIPYPIWMKLCMMIDESDISSCVNFGDDQLRGLGAVWAKFCLSPLTLIVVSTTLSCDCEWHCVTKENYIISLLFSRKCFSLELLHVTCYVYDAFRNKELCQIVKTKVWHKQTLTPIRKHKNTSSRRRVYSEPYHSRHDDGPHNFGTSVIFSNLINSFAARGRS